MLQLCSGQANGNVGLPCSHWDLFFTFEFTVAVCKLQSGHFCEVKRWPVEGRAHVDDNPPHSATQVGTLDGRYVRMPRFCTGNDVQH